MKYTAVIFDWDGVLGMTLHLWIRAYQSELQQLDLLYTDKTIVEDFFYEFGKAEQRYPKLDVDAFMSRVHDAMVSHISSLKTYPGAREMLETFQKNNVAVALVSSSPRRLLKEELNVTALEEFFSIIVAGDDVMKHKPDPEPFLNILEIGKFDPKSTLVLGDSHTDILAAHAARIDSCLFLPKENELFHEFDKLRAARPTYHVESLSEFSALIVKAV